MIITKTRRHSNSGFTLIELMIVVVIVAVLLGIALPAFQNQVIRGHRAAAKAEMLDIANRQQQFLLSDRTYASKQTLLDTGYALPDKIDTKYSFDISTVAPGNVPFFTLIFTAIGSQAADGDLGDLTLNSEGKREPVEKWER
jgi:type IV pilus assembly protein PilE